MATKGDGYIRWRCKSCNQRLKVKETYEGGNVIQCPRCGASVNVPMANIEAIAAGADMPETGQPGRIQLDREKLMRALKGDERQAGVPGSAGSTPSLKGDSWNPATAFGRLEQLAQLSASLAKIDQDTMGDVQRIYRNPRLTERQREAEVKSVAENRRREIKRLVENRLAGMRLELSQLEIKQQHLTRRQLTEMERLKRAVEALELYTRHVLGIDL